MRLNIRGNITEYMYRLRTTLWILPAASFLIAIPLFFITEPHPLNQMIAAYFNNETLAALSKSATNVASHTISLTVTVFALSVALTMIVLTQASSQLGPRIISLFLGSRQTQFVLGYYLATISFILLIDARIAQDPSPTNLPLLSIVIGFFMVLISPIIMIFFVSHLAQEIIPNNVAKHLSKSLNESIQIYTDQHKDKGSQKKYDATNKQKRSLHIQSSGFLFHADTSEMVKILATCNCYMELSYSPGSFLLKGQSVGVLYFDTELPMDIEGKLINCLKLEPYPPAIEDVENYLRKLVEMSLRALSPGINDPYTAIACLDYMFSSLQIIATAKELPGGIYHDYNGSPHLLTTTFSVEKMYNLAIEQIRECSRTLRSVHFHILDLIVAVLSADINDEARKILMYHAKAIITELRLSHDVNIHEGKIERYEQKLREIAPSDFDGF